MIIAIGTRDCKQEIIQSLEEHGIKCDVVNIMYEPDYYGLFEYSRHEYLKQFANRSREKGLLGSVAECGDQL